MHITETINLEKVYEDGVRVVLNGVSFIMGKSEFVSISGHSGPDKSILLHALGFLDQ